MAKRAIIVFLLIAFVSTGGMGIVVRGIANLANDVSSAVERDDQTSYFQNNRNAFMTQKDQVGDGGNPYKGAFQGQTVAVIEAPELFARSIWTMIMLARLRGCIILLTRGVEIREDPTVYNLAMVAYSCHILDGKRIFQGIDSKY